MHGCKIEIDWVDSETLESDDQALRAPGPGATASSSPAASAAAASRARSAPRASRASSASRTSASASGMQIAVVRVRPPRRRHAGRELDGVRHRDRVAGHRPAARAEGGLRPRRHDAPRRRPGEAPRRHAGARDLRRGGHLRAPPPPLRGVDQPAQAAGGGRPRRRAARRPTSAWSRSSSCREHPFFVASQFHPEFKSRPERPAPLFREFVARWRASTRARGPGRDAPQRRPWRRPRAARCAGGPCGRPTEAERRRLNELFAELCAIASPFGHERGVRGPRARPSSRRSAWTSSATTPATSLARVPARRPALRALAAAVRAPRHRAARTATRSSRSWSTSGWENAHDDDPRRRQQGRRRGDAAVAPGAGDRGLAGRRSSCCSRCSEENALAGAKAFDVARLRSRFGYVFDHATPIGEIVDGLADLLPHRGDLPRPGRPRGDPARGRAAARSSPPPGRSRRCAWAASTTRPPRTSARSTAASAGRTSCPSTAASLGEMRSIDDAKAEARRGRDGRRIHDAANEPTCDVRRRRLGRPAVLRLPPPATSPAVLAAEEALRACGYTPRHILSGGGSDANAFEAAGFAVRQPRQRHRAQPRADRARQRGCAGGDAGRGVALLDAAA